MTGDPPQEMHVLVCVCVCVCVCVHVYWKTQTHAER
jgi:hypothetical protein